MTVSEKRLGLLFILVGPTGAGKNTLMNRVIPQLNNLQQLPTATSRAIRENEQEGREHHFVTEAAFRQMIANDELLEWQNVHGRLYGVPRGTVEHLINNELDRIADIDVLGALTVKALYPDNTIIIFVQPGARDDVETTIRERLLARHEPEHEIENRLRRVKMEMSYAPQCDYLIINEDREEAVHTLHSIIIAERSRRQLANLRVRQNTTRRRLVFSAGALVLNGDSVLCHNSKLPEMHLIDGELPQEAAARSIKDVVKMNDNDALTQPLCITHDEHPLYEDMIFWYVYRDVQPQALPDEWEFMPLADAPIPGVVRSQLTVSLQE
ncbi:MAG: guanylate kinase [Chloroflexota bacterium]